MRQWIRKTLVVVLCCLSDRRVLVLSFSCCFVLLRGSSLVSHGERSTKSQPTLVTTQSMALPIQRSAKIKGGFDIEGHRGCRGLMPENSLPAFIKAIDLGVNTLELDVVVSRDLQLVVSHDAYFTADITLDPEGNPIPVDQQTQHNLFKMDYAEIRRYDVGSLGNKRFPEQLKIKTYKPLLSEVFSETRKYIQAHRLPMVRYNVETKLTPGGDGIFNPPPAMFAKLLYDEILKNNMEKHVMIQSFDVRTLQEFRKYPVKLPLVLLVENKDGIQQNIERLSFQPDVYSPHFSLVDEATVAYCRQRGMMIIPWTINEASDMEAMRKLNLDGIITDYPDRAVKLFRNGH